MKSKRRAVVTTDHLFGIYGELDIGESDEYTCSWSYNAVESGVSSIVPDPITGIGTIVELHGDDSSVLDVMLEERPGIDQFEDGNMVEVYEGR